MHRKDDKNEFEEFTNQKEFEKKKKLIESISSLQGKCDQIITKTDEECNDFINGTSQGNTLNLKNLQSGTSFTEQT